MFNIGDKVIVTVVGGGLMTGTVRGFVVVLWAARESLAGGSRTQRACSCAPA